MAIKFSDGKNFRTVKFSDPVFVQKFNRPKFLGINVHWSDLSVTPTINWSFRRPLTLFIKKEHFDASSRKTIAKLLTLSPGSCTLLEN